jgi:5-methylcytosine-specific restriction endonuclease McrA
MALPSKPRKCPICRMRYIPAKPMQSTCGAFDCMVTYAEKAAAKSAQRRAKAERIAAMEDRKIIRLKKESTRRLSWYADKAQASVNAYRRAVLLEAGEVCISCGKPSRSGKYHAGHFIPRNREPALRFAHLNIWLQCYSCNVSKSGNQLEYRKALMARADVGQEAVAWLEGPHEFPRLRQDDYRRIESDHKQLLKALKA